MDCTININPLLIDVISRCAGFCRISSVLFCCLFRSIRQLVPICGRFAALFLGAPIVLIFVAIAPASAQMAGLSPAHSVAPIVLAQANSDQPPEFQIIQPGDMPQQDGGTAGGDARTDGGVDAEENVNNALTPRSTLTEEPVESEGWAKSDFTGFIDIHRRLRQPDETLLEDGLRLVTADGFAPFNLRDRTGAPIGYHIELARSFCEQMNIACTIKVVPFETIPDLLANGEADAALAGLARHPDLQDKVAFSNVFLKRPGRFLTIAETALKTDVASMEDQPIAFIGGSAHEAFLRAYFERINRVPVNDLHAARALLAEGKVTAIFGDAFQLLPLATERSGIFRFADKPYYDDYFFGDGMTFAYKAGRTDVGNLLDYGLQKLAKSGRLAELYARHFALDVYATY